MSPRTKLHREPNTTPWEPTLQPSNATDPTLLNSLLGRGLVAPAARLPRKPLICPACDSEIRRVGQRQTCKCEGAR